LSYSAQLVGAVMAVILWFILPWGYHWLHMAVFFGAYGQGAETDDNRHSKLGLLSRKTPQAIPKRVSLSQFHPTDIQYNDLRVGGVSIYHFSTPARAVKPYPSHDGRDYRAAGDSDDRLTIQYWNICITSNLQYVTRLVAL
jgi:hypothetical protein